MEEYSFCDELIKEYKIEELNSETLKYRINKFIYACGMDLSDSPCYKEISPARIPYINKRIESDSKNYNVNFTRSYDREFGQNFVLLGRYNDLDFYFVNYFADDKRKDKINEIPFKITIGKVVYDESYKLDITSISKKEIRIVITRDNKDEMIPGVANFDITIKDFSIVLRLVKSFVDNPVVTYFMCKQINNEKRKNIIREYLDSILVHDVPIEGIEKIFKKIIK